MRKKKYKLEEFVATEFSEQVHVVQWARLHENREPRLKLLNASLAGVRLPIGVAKKCKAAGMKAGYPDLFLPVWRLVGTAAAGLTTYGGLYIELKRLKGGVISKDQTWWIDQLERQGYCVRVAKGAREAIADIKWYLNFDDGT